MAEPQFKEITVRRYGYKPLRFVEELIGQGEDQLNGEGDEPSLMTCASIYRTKAGRLIGVRIDSPRKSSEEGETYAKAFDNAEELITWLAIEGENEEEEAFWPDYARLAIESAAEKDAAIKAAWMESVE